MKYWIWFALLVFVGSLFLGEGEQTGKSTNTPSNEALSNNVESSGRSSHRQPERKLSHLVVTGNSVNIRTGPGTTFSRIGQLNRGTAVEFIRASGNWMFIRFPGGEGWMSSRYLAQRSIKKPPKSKTSGKPEKRCHPSYEGKCVPIASDVDCAGGSGNGPAYVRGPVRVVGPDVYRLDRDRDGYGCE
ncbi:SH3 domain-containing protein [Pelagimonas sp. KU-00592-HH]|uniref:SH3 domain-containing protein n=1 Tax=Pelagimonas sp. KU-00592-HH TaxID=3127651 RepID=UPI00333E5E92